MINWELEKEQLQKLILEDNISYEEIGRRYGCTGNNIKKAAKKLGIELPVRNIKNKNQKPANFGKVTLHKCLNCGKEISTKKIYCNHICQNEYQYKRYIIRWKEGKESGMSGASSVSSYIRKYLFDKFNSSCQLCGWNKINPSTGLVPLQVHHIDGDCTNNKEENLQLLCPNCHSLTETFGNLNKQSKRFHRAKLTLSESE